MSDKISKKKKHHYCAARQCNNNTTTSTHSFFRFPSEESRFKTWALACGRRDLINKVNVNPENYRLCAAHFDDAMFANPQKNRLQFDAVPTKQLLDRLASFSPKKARMSTPHIATESEQPSTSGVSSEVTVAAPEKHSTTPALEDRAIASTSTEPPNVPVFSSDDVSKRPERAIASQTGLTLSANTPRKQRLRKALLES